AQAGWPLRAVGVHNGSGYLPKDVNVAKAVLYTLMPAGSVIMVPDSFWNSEFWGAALFGAALRGARVLVIAPSYRSNSVDVFGTQLLTRELLARMLDARTRFAPALAAAGGLLQIGIYDSRIPTTDIPAKLTAVQETFAAEPWLRELFGFDPHVYEELDRLRAYIANVRTAPAGRDFERAPATKIHLKANLFASREAWTMMRLPSWGEMTWAFVSQRIVQVQDRPLAANAVDGVAEPTLDVGASEVQRWYASLAPAARERVVFYAVMGSQNQNARSMVMDAEDALVVAQWPSVIPYIDVVSLIGQSAWIADQEELDLLLPPMGPLRTWISHRARLAY
ncbi:MAG: hypothetical protein K1X31_15005, partial [Gemmatimonadaceae bacterium]|nr:hypothetical protein [Gemmatimonadaceae bacterium]